MPSITQQIVGRFAAALSSATSLQTYHRRVVPFAREEMPCINVKEDRETKRAMGRAVDEAELTVNVSIHERGDAWPDAADAIAITVHRCLTSGQQLRDLVSSIRHTGSDWEDHDADQTAGCLTLEYQIRYTVSASDISNSTIL
jgi:hypothetical protein